MDAMKDRTLFHKSIDFVHYEPIHHSTKSICKGMV